MKSWRRWLHCALLVGVVMVVAYLVGSVPVRALTPCQTCACKYIYTWKAGTDNFEQCLVDSNGNPVTQAYSRICSDTCPNTPYLQLTSTMLDRRQVNDATPVCDNSNGVSTCDNTVVEQTGGTLTDTVLGQTPSAWCVFSDPNHP